MSDFSCFDSPEALAINKARMDHFLSLGIPIQDKRVLEVGCGVGHLSAVLLEHGAMLFSIDARTENVKESGRRVTKPHHISAGDIQDSNAWGGWRTFDVVFAYGLLYHLSNPIQALCNMKTLLMPRGILALESIVIDHTRVDPRDSTCQTGPLLPIALLQDEESYGSNQGISNLAFGCVYNSRAERRGVRARVPAGLSP
jgi:2-polyprenyl-3-methyl-5-hydroxy-6-metoxy-1,4-benzoquinol methylase